MGRDLGRIAAFAVLVSSGAWLALFAGCGSSPAAADPAALAVQDAIQTSCDAAAPTACPMPPLRYPDIAPILQKSCVPCHPGPATNSQWPLTDYGDVAPWADVVQHDLCTYEMPPLDGGVAIAATGRLALLGWIQCGAPE